MPTVLGRAGDVGPGFPMLTDLERFLQLRAWLRSTARTCPMCSFRLALTAVERERRRDGKIEGSCPAKLDTIAMSCEDLARVAWPTRPKE